MLPMLLSLRVTLVLGNSKVNNYKIDNKVVTKGYLVILRFY